MTAIRVREHEHEPVPGLPGMLPEGERILWQGRPSAGQISRRVMRTRWLAVYFLLLTGWALVAGISNGRALGSVAFSVGVLLLMGTLLIAMVELFSYGVARTTLYTLTNRRVVLRIGVAFSVTVNLPFSMIASADMLERPDGTGTIALKLKPDVRLSLFVLWPHVRGGWMQQPDPCLRCIDDVEDVAGMVVNALSAAQGRRRTPLAIAEAARDAEGLGALQSAAG